MGRRGYSPEEVHRYLRKVADQLSRLEGEIGWQRARGEQLERRSVAAQEAAYARLSRDFADVVRRADEAATRVRAESESRARGAVAAAHQEAEQIVAAASEEAEEILAAAQAEAEHILRDATGAPAPAGSDSLDGHEWQFRTMWGQAEPADRAGLGNGDREADGPTSLFDPSTLWSVDSKAGNGDLVDLAGLEDLQSLRDFQKLEELEETEHLADLDRLVSHNDPADMDVHIEASLFDLFDDTDE